MNPSVTGTMVKLRLHWCILVPLTGEARIKRTFYYEKKSLICINRKKRCGDN